MEESYNIYLSYKAKDDLKKLLLYIKNNLKEPKIAKRYSQLIKKEIKTLEKFPKRHIVIDDFGTRRLIVKNYSVFYEVNEESGIVNVKRVLYSTSDWENKI